MLFKKNEIDRVTAIKEGLEDTNSNNTPQNKMVKTASNLYINSTKKSRRRQRNR
jgi:hypothetical protein